MHLGNHKGFTILECMLVVTIISIMLGIAIPAIHGPLAHYRLYAAGREMVSNLREFQQRALTEEKHTYKVKFFIDRGRHIAIDRYCLMEGINTLKTLELPASINLYDTNFSDEKMYISSSGYPAFGFGGTIQLENDNDERLYIIVAKTGRVRMDSKPPSSIFD